MAAPAMWQPQPQELHGIRTLLEAHISPNSDQARVRQQLQHCCQFPDFINYLVFLLARGEGESVEIRQAAGLLLKNNLRRTFSSMPPPSQQYIKAELLPCIGAANRAIRSTVGPIISIIFQIVRVAGWIELFQALRESLDSNDLDHMEGAMYSIYKICEDVPQELVFDVPGLSERPINVFMPRILQFFQSPHASLRKLALGCINQYIVVLPSALYMSMDQYLHGLFSLAKDPSADVRKLVCSAWVQLIAVWPSILEPHLKNVTELIIQACKDSDDKVALVACKFWSEYCNVGMPPEGLREFLPQLIPTLLSNMVYADDDESIADAEEDESFPDRDQDLKPRFHASRLHGSETGEDDDDDDDDVHVRNLRKCSTVGLEVLSNVFGDSILPTLMPLIEQNLARKDDDSWKEREMAVSSLGAIAEGCIAGLYPHLPQIVAFLIPLLDDKFPLIRSITCWTLSRYCKFIVQSLDHPNGREQFDKILLGLLIRTLDTNKRVQEAACSAFATLEKALGSGFAQFAEPVFQRCISLIQSQQLAKIDPAAAGALYDREFTACSLDLLSGLAEGLGAGIESLVYTEHELEQFLLDYVAGTDCPIPKLDLYHLDLDQLEAIRPRYGDILYSLEDLERDSKGVIRTFKKMGHSIGWRQKKLYGDKPVLKRSCSYYIDGKIVPGYRLNEFSIKDNKDNMALWEIIYPKKGENKSLNINEGEHAILLDPPWSKQKENEDGLEKLQGATDLETSLQEVLIENEELWKEVESLRAELKRQKDDYERAQSEIDEGYEFRKKLQNDILELKGNIRVFCRGPNLTPPGSTPPQHLGLTATTNGIEIDTGQPPIVFKSQLFTLTGVPPECQKIIGKGGTLEDNGTWSDLGVKDGQRLMMIGTDAAITKVLQEEVDTFVIAAVNNPSTRELSTSLQLPAIEFLLEENGHKSEFEILRKEMEHLNIENKKDKDELHILKKKLAQAMKEKMESKNQLCRADALRSDMHNQLMENAEKLRGVMDAANTRYTKLEAQLMTEIEELKAANLDLTRRCEFLEESLNREKSEKLIAVESYEKEKQERESVESSQDLLTVDLERVTSDAKRFSEQGGSNAGGSAGGGPLEFLRNNQEFQKFRDLVHRKPESLKPILQGLSEKNPQIIRLIDENFSEFLQFLSEPFEVGEGDLEQPEQDERPHVVFVTPEELEAIGRLESMGFERARVLEAFCTCDRNEEHAANYLLEHRGEEE